MTNLHLPDSFLHAIRTAFEKEGEKFLSALPSLIEEASQGWHLTDIQPVPNLSFNFVAFAKRVSVRPTNTGYSTSRDVILKIGVPHRELKSEIAALKLFNGNGACQLLESDEERGMFLLERLSPGTMLSELEDDDERTHIAVDVMQRMESTSLLAKSEQQAVRLQNFIQLSDWFNELKNVRPHFEGGTGPFPKEIFERVESFLPELFADKDVKLIHGDFHHFNILKSEERGWLVIDPKGVIGPVGYEVGPLMINPWDSLSDGIRPALSLIEGFRVQTERRIGILSERLGWEREKIIQWAMAHAVLSAWWDYPNLGWKYSINCARIFSEIK